MTRNINMKKICLFLTSLGLALASHAQDSQTLHKLVVADIETRVPLRGVIVSTMDGYRDTTNWRGVCYVPDKFDTLTVAKVNYLAERLIRSELKDSTFIIPSGSAIGEVTVWGKNGVQYKVDAWKEGTPLPSGGGSFDFAKMIDKRHRRDQKHLRKVRQKFTEMEQSEDPIVRAYNKALAEEERKAMEEAAEERKDNKQE